MTILDFKYILAMLKCKKGELIMNSIKKLCFIMILTIITIFSISLTCFATTEGIITEETVRLRKEASTSSNTLSLLAKDAKVEVLEQSGDWYKVNYGDTTGYVHKDYVKVADELADTLEENTDNVEDEVTDTKEENTNENSNQLDNEIVESEYKTVSQEQSIYIVPLINSSVINKINPNTKLSAIEEVNGWSYVTSDEFSGWLRTDKLVNYEEQQVVVEEVQVEAEEEEQQEEVTQETKIGYIKVDGANLRKEANTTGAILTVLYKNTEVTVISQENGWSKVKAEGLEGYISSDLISDTKVEQTTTSRGTAISRTEEVNQEDASKKDTDKMQNASSNTSSNASVNTNASLGQQIVNFAMKYKGYPYVYGGAGPSSFDCSGFTQYVYKQFGYSLPHSATSQSYCGTRVSKSELRLGDLVIFTEAGSSSIGHVGIYIGNSSFIHASSPSTGVIVSSLNGYYESRYVTSVRIY